ncbi:phage portal protein [Enterococcus pallens]|uniref:SPP1 family phage portal protein n=1 Tax=Enterococcus pallens ATCC BAA-351 TaxID=1158607 RepID=R2SPU3_9ENTE|nr:phage portal protein [Enterococcus pallens]EOH94826.1 SPP1 family phage portal protein [Enterococcus pallens ATCC BAA-351]EOU14855.1 SPP1 family phage portal protein [Enterococcus pallens ATCC BAA-351]OJG76228.1 SPP1 family phage portal protein [Enterococcus pallens]
MAIAIDRELAGDINNPSFDVINYCIEEHEKEIPRLQMLFDYYEGNPHKINETPRDLPHDRDEVFVNNAKYVTDMMVGFTVGAPVSYTAAKDKDIAPVLEALDAMRIKKHDKELEKGLSSMGVGYELHYLSIIPGTKNETIPKAAWIDPRGMILVVDDTIDRNKLFAVRPIEKQDLTRTKFWEVQVYTSKGVFTYKSKSKKLDDSNMLAKPKFKEHFYQEVPVVEFRNNEEKQGDYEQQLSQIDKYNVLQTDRIKDKENFIKAIFVLYGFSLPEDGEKSVNGNIVVEAPSQDLGAKAEYVSNTFQEAEVQTLADSLLNDFHKTTYVPNLNDEQFAGNISGEAMKYKLFGLLLILSIKIGYLEDGIIERLRLLQNILNVKGHNVDVEGTTIKFKPNLPIDRSNIIQQIRDSQEFIPLLISLGWLDDIDDPESVLDMLEEQKEKNLTMQAKALGIQSDDSHSDLDEPPEGDEDDDG